MKRKVLLFSLSLATCITSVFAENLTGIKETEDKHITTESTTVEKSRLSFGGYGEAVMSRMFYSNNYKRYSKADEYKNDPSHGQFDLPHVTFFVGYNFGKGWKFFSEIEFEHGGTESAIEIENEENGEYESEVERGGEVALEQFWIQKTFNDAFNLKMGHLIVPVGYTNGHHTPTEFFGVYRPEGENTILPCTWHETGVSLWGKVKKWRYELMFIAGLDADRFSEMNWVKGGAGSPYEFKIANSYAGVARIDNYSVPGLRLGLSGYVGNSAANTLKQYKYSDVKGTVLIGAFDFDYKGHNWIARGNFDYGNLSNSKKISEINVATGKDSPSPRTNVAKSAIAIGVEAGYNIFSQISSMRQQERELYLFARYDYYDSMHKTVKSILDKPYCKRNVITAGVNYFPLKNIVIKGEYSARMFDKEYNNEPTISLGIAYAGMFTK